MAPVTLPVEEATYAELTLLNDEWKAKVKKVGGDWTTACVSFVQNFEKIPVGAWGEEEEKAKERKAKVGVTKLNEICHKAYCMVYEIKSLAKRNGVEMEEQKVWDILAECKWNQTDAVVKADIKLENKPLLREPDFGEREFTKAALLNEDRGYLGSAGEKPFELTSDFVSLLGEDADRSPANLVVIRNRDGELERVIVQDCIRTFAGEDHRRRLEVFLNGAYIEFGNYSQGMAHVAAFLLLTLTEDDVIAILRVINKKIIPAHWKHESDGFGANAYVFQHVVEKHHPEFNEYFMGSDRNLLPEMYTRKWFCGLGLHCLDIELVYRFLRCLLKRGFEYLISFGMAVLVHLKERIMETDSCGELIHILALNPKAGVERADQEAILDLADTFDFSEDLGDEEALEKLRKELFDTHLKDRIERAKKLQAEAAEDEDICEECDRGLPVKWVDEDNEGTPICDECKIKYEAMGHEITEW
eukprot:TRINITY_DN38109_c0_g1_i1.p1 TRINITY_DN38109_c0_g1~~TRINITY_DN38109_c0_g1_i1.p1  ORF type:complete len:485 (+),score=191.93 TRINITY_DN38109_c0_g1_i1:38-1456(+)